MKIGIICATGAETTPFIEKMSDNTVSQYAMLDFYQGTLAGLDTVAASCGVGKVNAAIAAQVMIDRFGVDIIINAGAGGGMDPSLKIMDVVIAEGCVYHDVEDGILTQGHPKMESEVLKSDPRLLELARELDIPAHFGLMATGDVFIADEGRDEINRRYSPLSVDMETAGIAHTCYVNHVGFISVRVITDTAEHSGVETCNFNFADASVKARDVVLTLMEKVRNNY